MNRIYMEQSSTVGNSSHPPLISDITKTHTRNAFSDCFGYSVFVYFISADSHRPNNDLNSTTVLYQLFSSTHTRSSQQPTRVLRATIPQALLAPCLYTHSARSHLWISLKVKVSPNR